jgi:hypothetical protein
MVGEVESKPAPFAQYAKSAAPNLVSWRGHLNVRALRATGANRNLPAKRRRYESCFVEFVLKRTGNS